MPQIRVSITNLQSTLRCSADRLRRAVRAALQDVVERPVEISVAIVDDATIHDLNRRHLRHDYPTDVLSFPLENSREKLQGEIVVSAETAQRQAADYGWSADEELCLYVVHGALHLAGLGDKTSAQRRQMRSAEARVLAEVGISAHHNDVPAPRLETRRSRREVPSSQGKGARDAKCAGRKPRQ